MSRLPFVNRITPPSYARYNTGSVTTAGDAVLGTRSFRESGAGNGLGASVAVISNGVNSAADSAATGDLPDLSEIAQFGFCVPDELGVGLCDEGTAMLEIIHDLAPRAELGFCSAFTTLAFILCVDFDLAEDDEFQPDVIVDDVAFPFEPYFEDGPVAQAVAEAVARDVIYISAAGNFAQLHYEGDFLASTELGFDDGSGQLIPEHNFGLVAGAKSDPTMDIPLPPGASLMVVMQWSDGFGVSASDYDLLILDAGRTKVLAASVGLQNGDDDPIEDISFENLLPGTEVVQLVVLKNGGEDRRLEMFVTVEEPPDFEGDVPPRQYVVPEGSIVGHASVDGVISVGAVDVVAPDEIEEYSSQGPTRLYFPTLVDRETPDLVAVDGVAVTGAGGFPEIFYGTSAAAPHVAGAVALLIDQSALATPDEIVETLLESVVDLGTPGRDPVYGEGRLLLVPEPSPTWLGLASLGTLLLLARLRHSGV